MATVSAAQQTVPTVFQVDGVRVSRLLPAVVAVFGGVVLAMLLLVPFVFRSYRRRGEVGFGPGLLAFGFLVYGLALVAYTLLPIPAVDAAWCARHAAHPQLHPLQFVDDIRKYVPGSCTTRRCSSSCSTSGCSCRSARTRRRRAGTALAAGFGVSLLID